MAEDRKAPGTIGWFDLTVPEAGAVREFYEAVTGWTSTPLDMGGYEDYCMNAAGGETVAGICHARGANASLPPMWMIYINVADLDESLRRCVALGGKALTPVRSYGDQGRYCAIQDPAGAAVALFEPAR